MVPFKIRDEKIKRNRHRALPALAAPGFRGYKNYMAGKNDSARYRSGLPPWAWAGGLIAFVLLTMVLFSIF